MDQAAFYNWVQLRLWLWRLKALGLAGCHLVLAAAVGAVAVVFVLFVLWGIAGTYTDLPFSLRFYYLSGSVVMIVGVLLGFLLVLKTYAVVRHNCLEGRRAIRDALRDTGVPVALPGHLDPEMSAYSYRGPHTRENFWTFLFARFFGDVTRFCTLMGLGAGGAAAVLAFLAERRGLVAFDEIADLLGENADVERIIAGAAAIDGVVLTLSGEPKGIAVTSRLRARLRRTGAVAP